MAGVQQEITDLLQQRRNGKDPDFTVRNQQDLADTATQAARTMTWLLTVTACVSLVVGGIGVMNIMLVSVTERTREIGLRLAVGARGNDVLRQFLLEAVALSSLGGVIGIACGIAFSELIAKVQGWPVQISTFWVIIGFSVSALIGIIFGFFPAYKAAQLDPIEALRYE